MLRKIAESAEKVSEGDELELERARFACGVSHHGLVDHSALVQEVIKVIGSGPFQRQAWQFFPGSTESAERTTH
jgi:hypothetical protein